jgi:hypothetical protein
MLNPVDYVEPDILPSVERLVNFINNKHDWLNPTEYLLVEYFPNENELYNYKHLGYKLLNLSMNIDDDVLYSSDDEDILSIYGCHLLSFKVHDVIYIAFQSDDNMITISFDSGFIRIYY